MLNGSARRCRQVELQVIWCRPVLGALSLPMVRFSFLGGVTLMIEVTSFCRYARECEISHFFISREIHCEVKCVKCPGGFTVKSRSLSRVLRVAPSRRLELVKKA